MIPIEWVRRREPLQPEAVLLPRQTLNNHAAALEGRVLRGVACSVGLLVLGTQDELPWIPGASYFARSPHAPEIYLPTGLKPQISELLMARVVHRQATTDVPLQRKVSGPFVVIPENWGTESSLIVSVHDASVIDSKKLSSCLRAT